MGVLQNNSDLRCLRKIENSLRQIQDKHGHVVISAFCCKQNSRCLQYFFSFFPCLLHKLSRYQADLQAEHSLRLVPILFVFHPKREQRFSCRIFPFVSKQELHVVRIGDRHRFIIHDFLSKNISILLNSLLLHHMHSAVSSHPLSLVTDIVEKCSNHGQTFRTGNFVERLLLHIFHSLRLR